MSNFPRAFVPTFLRRSHPLKVGLTMVVVGAVTAGGVYATGRFDRTVATAAFGGALVAGFVATLSSWRTAKSLDRLVASADRRADGEDPAFDTARVDCAGRVADSMADTHETLVEEHRARRTADERADSLEATAREYAGVAAETAEGTLDARMNPADNEAMAELATEFNATLSTFEESVADLTRLADEVVTHGQEVAFDAAEVAEGSDGVVSSVEDISAEAGTQTDDLQSATDQMNRLATAVQAVAESTDEVATIAEQTVETGREGREAADRAVSGMNDIENESEETVEAIESLESEVQQVDELIDFIGEIAEQTNMLALNAHIEASRAGEQGAGFAAVANEIKELAERTKEAAADIEERLTRIRRQTDRTVDEVRDTSARIAQQTDSVENAAEALADIADYARETNAGVQEISDATREQADSTEEALEMVEDAAEVSEGIRDEAETVASSADAQTTALSAVSDTAAGLAEQATRLGNALESLDDDYEVASADFEVDATGEPSESDEPEESPADSEAVESIAEDPIADDPVSDDPEPETEDDAVEPDATADEDPTPAEVPEPDGGEVTAEERVGDGPDETVGDDPSDRTESAGGEEA
ncbi:methyl-accepting chemotaxis protein [Halorussus lipolyticus]|uniref:methyl-accepting chemotaxis protein n=1 Tax=Halorussus lipolyticus TaxID=3034024 RepID=UPI0023E85CEF|nr:methyl-accepting chemotaxis protein [Halorussus sp. DT80]